MTTKIFKEGIYTTPLHSRGPKIRSRCKQHVIILCNSQVIVSFVSKFVVIAMRIGRGEILITPSDNTTG